MHHQIIILAILLSTSGFSLIWGGAPERIVALILLTGTMGPALLAPPVTKGSSAIEPGILPCDMAVFACLLGVALRSTRFWPIWAAGLTGSELIVDLVRAFAPHHLPGAYLYVIGFWGWSIQIILVAGTVRHQMRLGRTGSDDPWKMTEPDA